MKWRLALKLGASAGPGRSSIGWAAFRLAEPKVRCGSAELPVVNEAAELLIISYADPNEMLEPMRISDFEAGVTHVMESLPAGSRLRRVPFDAADYQRWRKRAGLPDSHDARAQWALRSAR